MFLLARRGDTLLWRPSLIDDKNVQNYITKINSILERDGLPCGSCDRDNEHALFTLQSCDYDGNKALGIFSIEIQSASGNISNILLVLAAV